MLFKEYGPYEYSLSLKEYKEIQMLLNSCHKMEHELWIM